MNNFDLYNPTHIYFGKDRQKDVGAITKKYASKVLLHYGGGSIKKSGLYGQVTASLKAAGIECAELGGVVPNPRVSLVREGIKLCREQNINFILAVGGGSVIDSAKAIALGVPYGGDVWDFFIQKAKPKTALPIGTILTIPATGSESSLSVVISDEESKMKLGYRGDIVRPAFSILNPELCFTLPKEQAAYSACDMMAHIFERYFTNTPSNDLTDNLCEAALKAIIANAPKVLANMQDYDAWAQLVLCGNIAHNGVLGMGRQEDWASHAIEHALSAQYDIAHGLGLAMIIPAWMRYVYKTNTPLFERYAANVWGLAGALEGIERTEEFFKSLGLPTRLSAAGAGIKKEDFAMLAAKVTKLAGSTGFFKKLNAADVETIYNLAY